MEIPKTKSQSPKIYDDTEGDLILVPPSVLENKLIDFEKYHSIKGALFSEIALAVTLIVAVIATDFKDIFGLNGATIRGAFLFGFIAILIKIGFGIYNLIRKGGKTRKEIINELKIDKDKSIQEIKNLKKQ